MINRFVHLLPTILWVGLLSTNMISACDQVLQADEFAVASSSSDQTIGNHFHSSNGNSFTNGANLMEIGEFFSEAVRGMAEFNITDGPTATTAALVCYVDRRGGLFSNSNDFVVNDFEIDVEAYVGNNQEDVSDFQETALSLIGSFNTANQKPGDVLSWDVTPIYNAFVGAGYPSLGIRMSTTEDTQQGAFTVGQCELCLVTNQPPVAQCVNHTIVTTDSDCNPVSVDAAALDAGSVDPDGDALIFAAQPSGPYPLGMTEVEVTVSDGLGGISMCIAYVEVIDVDPPLLECPWTQDATVSDLPASFALTITDNCDETPQVLAVDYDCWKESKKELKSADCSVQVDGGELVIESVEKPGVQLGIAAVVADVSGNVADWSPESCNTYVKAPKGSTKGSPKSGGKGKGGSVKGGTRRRRHRG